MSFRVPSIPQPVLGAAIGTMIFDLFPLAVYGIGRAVGTIPSEESWSRIETNHGPLYGTGVHEWLGACIYMQIMLMIAICIICLCSPMAQKPWTNFWMSLTLLIAHITAVCGGLFVYFWTID